jgi:DNA-binding CsgD family transcriptional regulator
MLNTNDSLLSSIYDCSINSQNWDSTIDRSVEYVGAKGGILASIPTGDEAKNWSVRYLSRLWRELPPENLDYIVKNFYRYEQEAWQTLLKISPLAFKPDNEAYANTDNLDEREDYAYLRKHTGVRRKVGIRLNSDLGWFDTIAFQFDEQHSVIPSQSKLAVNQLAVHFAKSVELSRTFNVLRMRYQAVLAALDHVDIGLCVINANGLIATTNEEANRIFSDSGLIFVNRKGRLQCRNQAATDQLEQLLADTLSVAPGTDNPVVVLREPGHEPVYFHVSHLRDSSAELGEPLEGALVSIVDMSKATSYDTLRFSAIYSLTPAEADVSKHLIEGLSSNEIAEIRSVSADTIRSQIKSIYSKTQVNDRIALVRLVLKTTPPVTDR